MKFKNSLLVLTIILCALGSQGQNWTAVLSPSRATDWSTAGAGAIPNRTAICSTLNPGATATQIDSAIAACAAGQVVFLSAGTYNLTSGIVFNNKSNVTLRGAGPDQTFLVFSAGSGCAGWGGTDVCFMSGDTGDGGDANYSNAATWSGGYSAGTSSITIGSISKGSINNLQIGSMIFLDQLDDSSDTGQVFVCQVATVCSSEGGSANGRAGRGQQQPVQVTSISGSGPWTVGISPGIRMPNISSSKSPQAWWDKGLPIQNDGIENLSIDHTNTSAAAGAFILNGYNIWLKNIRSFTLSSAGIHKHVWMYQTTHVTIRDSYFYGAGTGASESYGIDTFNGADNLVENNIFQHISNPMMNEGCLGCVEAYNYAVDDYYIGPGGTAPQWQQGSSYHHSVGDAFILWESNQGVGLTSDDVHGSSNFVTAFRNYWTGRDTAGGGAKIQQTSPIILNANNRYYNIIGNVLGTNGYHNSYVAATPNNANCETSIYVLGWGGNCGSGSIPDDPLVASTLVRWGNYDTVNSANRFVTGELANLLNLFSNLIPSTNNLPTSFYMSTKPSWWGAMPFPAIGPDVSGAPGPGGHVYDIPAKVCYDGSSKTNAILNFNANNCYGSSSGVPNPPLAPTGLGAVIE